MAPQLYMQFSRLVALFGQPEPGNEVCNKTLFEWTVKLPDGTEATIFDYKASCLYDGDDDLPTPYQIIHGDAIGWEVHGNYKGLMRFIEGKPLLQLLKRIKEMERVVDALDLSLMFIDALDNLGPTHEEEMERQYQEMMFEDF